LTLTLDEKRSELLGRGTATKDITIP